MPDHTTWVTFLLHYMKDTLQHNAQLLGTSVIAKSEPTWRSWEPFATAVIVSILLLVIGVRVRARLSNTDEAVIPEDKLTLRTFMEAFLGFFYDLSKSVMDADRAKKYFPIIAVSACFVFFSNILALVPGMSVATSHLSITFGCAIVVFVLFNLYGIKEQGIGPYLKHLAGPAWYLAPLIFVIETISLCVRPVTLAVRLMVNMAVDHLLLATVTGLIALLVPLPVLLLGCLVIVIQTLVFTLLTTIYIGLATEHEAH